MRWKGSVLLLAIAVLAAWNSGCIIAMDVKNPCPREQVVVLDGQLHVVNTKTNRIRPFEEAPETDDEVIIRSEVVEDDN